MASNLQQLEKDARAAGYTLIASEQLRANRWLLVAHDGDKKRVAILVQERAMIGESDVQDLAELVQVRNLDRGMLVVHQAAVSSHAQRAVRELGTARLRICAVLPPAHGADVSAATTLAPQSP